MLYTPIDRQGLEIGKLVNLGSGNEMGILVSCWRKTTGSD
jgi:hypothetical protein